jgi:hypothetical protein
MILGVYSSNSRCIINPPLQLAPGYPKIVVDRYDESMSTLFVESVDLGPLPQYEDVSPEDRKAANSIKSRCLRWNMFDSKYNDGIIKVAKVYANRKNYGSWTDDAFRE